MGMEASQLISGRINDAVEKYRIASYNIPGLDKILEDVKCDIKLRSYTMDEDGKESISESGVYMAVSMALGIIIYMFIVMFGGMVMSSVIEEKASRVAEPARKPLPNARPKNWLYQSTPAKAQKTMLLA